MATAAILSSVEHRFLAAAWTLLYGLPSMVIGPMLPLRIIGDEALGRAVDVGRFGERREDQGQPERRSAGGRRSRSSCRRSCRRRVARGWRRRRRCGSAEQGRLVRQAGRGGRSAGRGAGPPAGCGGSERRVCRPAAPSGSRRSGEARRREVSEPAAGAVATPLSCRRRLGAGQGRVFGNRQDLRLGHLVLVGRQFLPRGGELRLVDRRRAVAERARE